MCACPVICEVWQCIYECQGERLHLCFFRLPFHLSRILLWAVEGGTDVDPVQEAESIVPSHSPTFSKSERYVGERYHDQVKNLALSFLRSTEDHCNSVPNLEPRHVYTLFQDLFSRYGSEIFKNSVLFLLRPLPRSTRNSHVHVDRELNVFRTL